MNIVNDIIIVGGGVSGVMCGLTVKQLNKDAKVLIIEGSDRLLKKLAVSGNGRGNFTNKSITVDNYFGNKEHIGKILKDFSNNEAISFFDSLGIMPTEIEGKIYPKSLTASSLSDAMLFEADRLGIEIVYSKRITKVKKLFEKQVECEVFCAIAEEESFYGKKIVFAFGGSAAPHLLTDGKNYKLLEAFKHTLITPKPALVHLLVAPCGIAMLNGIKVTAKLSIIAKAQNSEKEVFSCVDEVHFNKEYLSGSATFLASPYAVDNLENGKVVAKINFLHEYSFDMVLNLLKKRREKFSHLTAESLLNGVIHNTIAKYIIKKCHIILSKQISALTDNELSLLAKALGDTSFDIIGTSGFKYAQSTLGGICLEEFNNNLMSKKVDNLYAIGELLDVCGICGGYNITFALACGYKVGKELAKQERN